MSPAPLRRLPPATLLFLVCLTAVTLSACTAGTPEPSAVASDTEPGQPANARVVVTADFGEDVLLDVTVALADGTTAIEALDSVAELETSYGACFVESINGVGGTGGKVDWFYYINGMLGDVGSCDYVLCDGDVQHWDYHDWRFRRDVTATLGAFPHAFLRGYGGAVRPTTIVCDTRFTAEAASIADSLMGAGATDVTVTSQDELAEAAKETHNLVIVSAIDNSLVSELYGIRDRVGLFTSSEDSTLITYDYDGTVDGTFGAGSGVVEAMQNPWNPRGTGACENVVVLVTGTDDEGVRSAVDALALEWGDMELWPAAIVEDGMASPVPRRN